MEGKLAILSPGDSISIMWYGSPCHCRCRHCLLENTGKQKTIPFARAKGIVEKFIIWAKNESIDNLPIWFTIGNSCDFPNLVEYIEFGRKHGIHWARFLALNGIAYRNSTELEDYLLRLKDAGVSKIGLTFFGTEELHDCWAKRKGDFKFLLLIAEIASRCGLERHETLFMVKEGFDSLPSLIARLDAIPGLAGRSLSPWDYRGFGKYLENERPTLDSIKPLPEGVKQFINFDTHKSESQWIRWLAEGNIPKRKQRNYLIVLSGHNIELIENTTCDEVIDQLRLQDEQFIQAIPPILQLAERFGHRWGKRFYTLRDLEWKWIERYLDEHSEIGKAGGFSDLTPCVMWK